MQKLEKEAMENCHDVSWPRCNEVPYQRFLAFAALLISCWRMPAVHIKKKKKKMVLKLTALVGNIIIIDTTFR